MGIGVCRPGGGKEAGFSHLLRRDASHQFLSVALALELLIDLTPFREG